MNNYIKPTIKLAIVNAAAAGTSCGTTANDMELIQSVIGGIDADKTFGSGEPCEIQVPLDMYCKFTSAQTGAVKIFWS